MPKEYGASTKGAAPQEDVAPLVPKCRSHAMNLAHLGVALCIIGSVSAVLSVSSNATGDGGQVVMDTASLGEKSIQTDDASASGPQLSLSNEYERSSGRNIGNGLYGFYVADVAKPTILKLEGGSEVMWSIPGVYTSESSESQIEVTFPTYGVHKVSIAPALPGSGLADPEATTTFEVSARLIRRELRSLSDDDRERFFAAMHHVYTVDDKEGQKLWGSKYHSAAWLVREHLYGAADIECDHWHDDAGILNHHIGITWQLEQSLYAIDNKTAAHYWDYTLDASQSYNWWESVIFDDDWFGTVLTNDTDRVVTTGRWAYTPVLEHARGFSNITNPYGLLRSPWNTNPTPYLMRSRYTVGHLSDGYTTFPYCSCFSSFMMDSTWIGSMLFALNGALHGPVHIMIRGHWSFNSDKWSALSNELTFSDAMLLLAKALWRQGWIRCPETCSSDTPSSECQCGCPAAVIGNRTAKQVFAESGMWKLNPNSDLIQLLDSYDLTEEDLLELLCEVGHPGEMFTSAAPQDPTFWPLHGMAERFIQYARILKTEGTLTFDETWGYSHATQLPSDTGLVCDWDAVNSGETLMPTCVHETCPGHKISDTLPFTGLLDSQDGLYTNEEFYELTSPYSVDLPYAYDTLSYWPGCTDDTLISSTPSGAPQGMAPMAMPPSKLLRAEDPARRAAELGMRRR